MHNTGPESFDITKCYVDGEAITDKAGEAQLISENGIKGK